MNDRQREPGYERATPLERAPVHGDVQLIPTLVLDGGRAVRGDVRSPVIAPDKFVDWPGGGTTIVPHAVGGVPGESAPLKFKWPYDGIVIEWKFVVVSDPSGTPSIGMTHVKARLDLGGENNEELITNDSSAHFQCLQQLTPYEERAQPIYRIARNGVIWTLTFQNTHPTIDYTPDLRLGVRRVLLEGCSAVKPERAL